MNIYGQGNPTLRDNNRSTIRNLNTCTQHERTGGKIEDGKQENHWENTRNEKPEEGYRLKTRKTTENYSNIETRQKGEKGKILQAHTKDYQERVWKRYTT